MDCVLSRIKKNIYPVAVTFVIATFVVSCGDKIVKGDLLDLTKVPLQTVDSMYAVQTGNGMLQMRMEASVMERYSNDKESYELFPRGFSVYAYNNEGLLETHIYSRKAKHTTTENDEKWAAYGDVVILNYLKGERMETDTLYWDRQNKKIFTDCFVKLHSPDGFMQGYGMESDEMARNAEIMRPFDSFGIIRDSTQTEVYRDTVNFIGPLPRADERKSLRLTNP